MAHRQLKRFLTRVGKMNEPIQVTLLVIDALEKLDISYFIGGSFASTTYGHVRTTRDVDIIALIEQKHVTEFVNALDNAFYLDEEMIRAAISRRSSFNLIHLENMFKADIFLPKERPFDTQQFSRRVKRMFDKDSDREVYFASAEDTILAKLEWFRMGGEESELQWRDVQSILRLRSEQLDFHYMQETAKTMQLSNLLERLLSQTNS